MDTHNKIKVEELKVDEALSVLSTLKCYHLYLLIRLNFGNPSIN